MELSPWDLNIAWTFEKAEHAAASLTLLNLWVQHAFYVINTKEPRKCALGAHRSNFLSSLVGCRHTQLHPSRPTVDDTKFTAK